MDAKGVEVVDNIVTILSAGNYSLSGTLKDGQIIIDSDSETPVRLILDGLNISSSTSAPIYIKQAHNVVIFLTEGTSNSVSDASTLSESINNEYKKINVK